MTKSSKSGFNTTRNKKSMSNSLLDAASPTIINTGHKTDSLTHRCFLGYLGLAVEVEMSIKSTVVSL